MTLSGSAEYPLPGGGCYTIRHSKRARRMRIEVRLDSLLVVLPGERSLKDAHRLVDQRLEWISRARQRLRAQMAERAPAPEWVSGANTLLWRGSVVRLKVWAGVGPAEVVGYNDQAVELRLAEGLSAAQALTETRQALRTWLIREAEIVARGRLPELVDFTGLRPTGLRIAGQRTRWGSCGVRGRINLNWRLIMAPPEVLDYVLVHELCHLRQRNHSPRFWKLVESVCPDWRVQHAWLRENGRWLLAALE